MKNPLSQWWDENSLQKKSFDENTQEDHFLNCCFKVTQEGSLQNSTTEFVI